MKGDSMDLRLDIERRKIYSTHDSDYNQDQGRDLGESPDCSKERSLEKFSKCQERSKKHRKKRSRSSSSSSSSSSKSHKEETDPKEKGFNKARLGQRGSPGPPDRGGTHGGFQVRFRGRGWNRGGYQGNCTQSSNTSNVEVHPKNEDWDPEFTPKSRKYYLHDDRDGESEWKWVDGRGRGRGSFSRGRARFIIRKATGAPNKGSSTWANDKFQANGGKGGQQEAKTEPDHKDGRTDD